MALAVQRFFEHAWLPVEDGPGRLINLHNDGETAVDPAMVTSVFPFGQIGMAQLDAASDAMEIAPISATTGGATTGAFGNLGAGPVCVAFYFRLGGTANDQVFFGDIGFPTTGIALVWKSTNSKIEVHGSAGLLATSNIAVAAGDICYAEFEIDEAGTYSLTLYSVSGTTHTVIDATIVDDTWPNDGISSFSFYRLGTQNIDVGAGYVALDGFVPIGWRVNIQVPKALGTYQDLHATTAWRTNAGSILEADILSVLSKRDTEGSVNTGSMVCDATVVPKKLSMTMTHNAIGANTIYMSRFFVTAYTSVAAGGTTGRAFIRYNGTDFFCTAFGGVQVATVYPSGLAHGRGLRAGSTNWNVTPTAALLDTAEVGYEYTADGTSNLHFDCAQLMTMFAPDTDTGIGSPIFRNVLLGD